MIRKVPISVIALLAIILLLAASRAKTFRIQRSINIEAPPERVFELIDDLHNWPLWAPQDKEDATMKRTYSGTDKGTGAVSQWTSSGSAGKGSMLITAVRLKVEKNQLVGIFGEIGVLVDGLKDA